MAARGTGFELGGATGVETWKSQFLSGYTDPDYVDFSANGMGGPSNTGNFFCRLFTGAGTDSYFSWAAPDGTTNELYVSFFMDLVGNGKGMKVGVILGDASQVYLQKDIGVGNNEFHAYVDVTKVADGTETVPNGAYGLVEIYFKISATTGSIQSSVGGVADISYTGDTLPGGSTTITDIFFEMNLTIPSGADYYIIDDVTLDTDDAPGDVRYILAPADANYDVQWTAAAGSAVNYENIDEIDDATYNSSTVVGEYDIYSVTDWALAKQIYVVNHYVRAQYVAGNADLDILLLNGAFTNTDTRSLSNTWDFYWAGYRLNPNTGGLWFTSVFNDTYIGQQFGLIGAGATIQVSLNTFEVGYLQNFAPFPTAGAAQSPDNYIESLGPAAPGGEGGAAGGNYADISPDGLFIYIAAYNDLNEPILLKIATTLTADATVVFEPGAAGRIGVQAAKRVAGDVWVAGKFDGTNRVEKSDDYGATWTVKDPATFGTIRTFNIGPGSDDRILLFDGDNGDIIESTDGGSTWTTINAAVSQLINSIARYPKNVQELATVNQGAANNSVNYSINTGGQLVDYQTGVYPNQDGTKVIVGR